MPDIKPDKDTLTGQNAGKVSFGHRIAPLIILLLMILVMAYILAIDWAPEVIDVPLMLLFWLWPIAAIGLIIWSSIILMKKKQIFGCILVFSSAAVCFISIFISISIFDAYSNIDHQDPSSLGFYVFFLQVVSLFVIFLISGIIMFFTGKSQAKKQKNQNIP